MLRIWLMVALFVTAALSGCASAPEDEDERGDDTETGIGPGPGAGPGDGNDTITTSALVVTWLEVPNGSAEPPLSVAWRVDLESDGSAGDGNNTTTGDDNATAADATVEVEETGLVYGTISVAAPSSPSDYDNVTAQVNDTTVPGDFEASLNATGDSTLYLRAYVLHEGTYYWTVEVQLNATGAAGGGVEHEIVIQDGTVPVDTFARFDADELTIQAGDSVVWNNTASGSHNIAITGPEEFETGEIASGEASDPIVFQTAGEYTFEFESGSSATGTITVEG